MHSRIRRHERAASLNLMVFSQLIVNDNDEKCSIQITVISSEARNPYDVARASSISGCKGLPPYLESRTAYCVVSGISRHFVPRNDTLKESFQTMIRNAFKPPVDFSILRDVL